jgi:MFS family permease
LTASKSLVESPYAWARLAAALALMTVGGCGMYAISVVLPLVQAEFSVARSDASLAYTFTMIGFGLGGILMGRLSDRYGVIVPVIIGALGLCTGFVAAGTAGSLWQFDLAQGLLIGLLGTSATFAPLVADISLWFTRRRGIAVAICISGNYLAGTVWPPLIQHYIEAAGWRQTYIGIGVFCLAAMLPLALALRRRPPALELPQAGAAPAAAGSEATLGLSPGALQALLCVAGVACCVAMSMPQVHLVAYCGDLGYGVARGAEMLSIMLSFGIASRIGSGFIADRIGGLTTMLLGSVLQACALLLYLWFDGLMSLYIISAFFGLVQGGIVPMYAVIVRDFFPPHEAGTRVGLAVMATIVGMALGGWLSGAIFDLTGSYAQAFANGIAWNLLNVSIVAFLMLRRAEREAVVAA